MYRQTAITAYLTKYAADDVSHCIAKLVTVINNSRKLFKDN